MTEDKEGRCGGMIGDAQSRQPRSQAPGVCSHVMLLNQHLTVPPQRARGPTRKSIFEHTKIFHPPHNTTNSPTPIPSLQKLLYKLEVDFEHTVSPTTPPTHVYTAFPPHHHTAILPLPDQTPFEVYGLQTIQRWTFIVFAASIAKFCSKCHVGALQSSFYYFKMPSGGPQKFFLLLGLLQMPSGGQQKFFIICIFLRLTVDLGHRWIAWCPWIAWQQWAIHKIRRCPGLLH